MSKQNNYDTEKIKRGIKLVCKTLSEKKFVDAQSNKYDRNKERHDYVIEDNNQSLIINFPESININIECKISHSSSKSARNRELDKEYDEYMKAQKRINWAGGAYMPR